MKSLDSGLNGTSMFSECEQAEAIRLYRKKKKATIVWLLKRGMALLQPTFQIAVKPFIVVKMTIKVYLYKIA